MQHVKGFLLLGGLQAGGARVLGAVAGLLGLRGWTNGRHTRLLCPAAA